VDTGTTRISENYSEESEKVSGLLAPLKERQVWDQEWEQEWEQSEGSKKRLTQRRQSRQPTTARGSMEEAEHTRWRRAAAASCRQSLTCGNGAPPSRIRGI